MFRKEEVANNSDEQVEIYIRSALALVEHIDPPDDLREAVFSAAVNLFSSKQVLLEQAAPVMAVPKLG